MMIQLAWPAKALSPNHRSRSHWPRTNALKAAKMEGFGATLAAMHGCKLEFDGRLAFIVTAYPPDKRERDDDNLIASLKGHRDGIARALGMDDKLFDQRPIQWAEPCKPGKIIVTIGEGE
jgi:Holliday junction resolvase RusA-like endonuclease